MTTPLNTMADWFESLPDEIRNDAGFLMYMGIARMIGDSDYDMSDAPGDAFIAWMRKDEERLAGLPKTLLARAQIRFTMIEDRGTQDSWDRALENNKAVLASIADDPTKASMRDHAEKMIADLPRRAALYIEIAQNWKSTIEPLIDDKAIEKWHLSTMFKGTTS
ncbi:hypothetical protein [Burkholderia pseudomallei]|uniref:hypothetical protein n=1 Tax=Burkholderia pseudomallei TaxID=28450 RepID=UPI000E695E36|nr:hypothetical protein [Burkholderia pseudomallei]RIV54217.1 hypothetical protein D2W70_11660 [Burkholderia pseudomallei]RIV63430.1 hypothetical protein D2W49_09785 [Burkholderia pseudomallei]